MRNHDPNFSESFWAVSFAELTEKTSQVLFVKTDDDLLSSFTFQQTTRGRIVNSRRSQEEDYKTKDFENVLISEEQVSKSINQPTS